MSRTSSSPESFSLHAQHRSPDEPRGDACGRAELERRIEEYHRDPNSGEPWEAVRAEILRDLELNRVSAATGDDLCEDPGPLTPAQCAELDRRLEECDRDPDGGTPWEVVREELLRRVADRRASAA